MKKILIVEDDLVMQRIIEGVIRHHFPEFELLKSVVSVASAQEAIRDFEPDLVLLDIILPDGTAFDLLRAIEMYHFEVVFMSEHDDYMQEAIRFSSVSFVSKPFDVSDLVLAIDKACDAISESENQHKIEILLSNTVLPASDRMVVFPTVDTTHAVSLSTILYGEAIPGGCIMHIETGKDIFIPRPLRRYEQLFSNYAFFRCHPLFVVNLRQIESVDEFTASLYLLDGTQIPLEPRKYELLKQRHQDVTL